MRFDGAVAVVTGVGPGLGRAVALALAREGADLVLAARRPDMPRAVAAEVEAAGRRALVVTADVTDRDDCRRLAEAAEAFGPVRVHVGNVFAEDVFVPFHRVELDQWRRLMEANCFGPLQAVQALVPALRRAAPSAVVFVNSMIVRKPLPLQGGYMTAKAALLAASRQLALELGRHRVRVNSVLPGWMWGPQVEQYVAAAAERRGVGPEEVVADITAAIPLGAVPTDDQVAEAVVFLASDRAAAVTGQGLDVNGGEVFA